MLTRRAKRFCALTAVITASTWMPPRRRSRFARGERKPATLTSG